MPKNTYKRVPASIQDITGKTFCRLSVVGFDKTTITPKGQRIYRWKCRCVCGRVKSVWQTNLTHGNVRSCGCLKHDLVIARSTKHGLSPRGKMHPIYSAWRRMKNRCLDKNSKDYKDYGGRGIKIAKDWMTFEVFVADMLPGWRAGLSLGRTNNELGYSKDNVKWCNSIEQANNTRRNIFITYHGITLTVAQWARRTGIEYNTLAHRVRAGWPKTILFKGSTH